ncbi:MAG TPA: hypothetical protein VM324_16760 [Egibacteraceae bacterium]|nr:hypothetical protein [Egibacteraceae bacterium]
MDDGPLTALEPGAGAATRGRRRRRLVVAGVVALVVVAVAFAAWRLVGGGDLRRLAAAPDATIAARTAHVAVAGTVEGVPVVGPFTLAVAEGEVDFAAQRALLRREVPGASVPLLRRLLPEPVQLLHDRGDTYVRLPVGGREAWVRVGDADDPAGPGTAAPGLTNPVAALGLLRALEGMPEALGEESVRGQPSTRFRVTVDLDRAAEALSGWAEDVARGLRRLRGRGDLPLDVWLDAGNRVTRLRYTIQPDRALTGGIGVTLVTDVELHAFGAGVDIVAPRADELVTVPAGRLRELDPFARLGELFER